MVVEMYVVQTEKVIALLKLSENLMQQLIEN